MIEFDSWRSYQTFASAVRTKRRFIPTGKQKRFLDAVCETASAREEILSEGASFWRAQRGCDWKEMTYDGKSLGDEEPVPFGTDRMKPLPNQACEGRANPRGIPYLYLSTSRETAMAEVRPWIGSYLSVGRFQAVRRLRIVNCVSENKSTIYFSKSEPPPEKREKSVWSQIDRAFARPVTASESTDDYAPTQILAELFKSGGFDGVAYRSSLGEGHNIALFDLNSAEIIGCHIYSVESITFGFHEANNPWYI